MSTDSPGPPIGATEVHDLHSEAVGETFRVFIAHCGDEPECTLVATDGNGQFGLITDSVRALQIAALVPNMRVVSIGYPNADTLVEAAADRARDLTPSEAREGTGGGEAFASFLSDELRPWLIERDAKAWDDVTFFGHSFGSTFGVHTMFERPGLFDRYIHSSPALWWDDEMLFDVERRYADEHDDLVVSAFFGVGAKETHEGRHEEAANLPEDHPYRPKAVHLDMVDDMQRFVDQLRAREYPSLGLDSIVLDDEFHLTVSGVVLTRGLRHFWAGRHAG